MNLVQRRPDGLVPGVLQVPYQNLVYRINGPYQIKTGTYLVGTPDIRLGTILNAGGRDGEFFSPSYFVAIFKEQRLYIRSIHFAFLRIGLIGTEDAPLIMNYGGCLSH